MEDILKDLVGKRVDVNCGSSSVFQGEVVKVKDSVLELMDEDERTYFIAIRRIIAVSETTDSVSRPGFIG